MKFLADVMKRWWMVPALCMLFPALAFGQVNLTFSVDMTNEILEGNFDPETQAVDIRGTFNDWSGGEAWELDPTAENDSIYAATFEFSQDLVGDTLMFKFHGHDWEGAIGDRQYIVTDEADQDLPLAVFNVPYYIDASFYVDMSGAIDDEIFDVAQDSVVMRGYFQEMAGDTVVWAGNMFKLEPVEYDDVDNVYGITIRFDGEAAGEIVEWKFVIVGPGDDIWEGIGNRTWELSGDQVQVLPLFEWDTPFGDDAVITFQVDMRAQILAGNFDPDRGDYVVVAGAFNGWSTTADTLYEDFEVEGWYDKDIEVTAGIGEEVPYKYHMVAGDGSSMPNGGWEFGADRTFEFTGENIVLERRFWSDIDLEGVLEEDVDVTFRFDRSTAVDDEGALIEGDLYIAGGNPPLFWVWDDTEADRSHLLLTETEEEDIYEVTITFTAGSIRSLEYKYGIEVQQNDFQQESGFQENRTVEIPQNVYSIIVEEAPWGDWEAEAVITSVDQIDRGVPMVFSLEQNYPNPFNPATNIQYSIAETEKVVLKVYNVLGQEVKTIVNEVQNPGTYRATFDASHLSSGVYIYRIQAGDFVESKRMMFIK